MIREGKKLPADVQTKIPAVIAEIAEDKDVIALYGFGSLAEGRLKPLSDLDFGILLSDSLNKQERFRKSINLIGIFNKRLNTDAVDLVILNDGPFGFAYNIVKTGKLLYCLDQRRLIDFVEETTKMYLDFKPTRDRFDRTFLEGIGYRG